MIIWLVYMYLIAFITHDWKSDMIGMWLNEKKKICLQQLQWFEPPHDKTNSVVVHPVNSDQPGHLPSLIRVFAVRSMGS